jgi:hypothetical protein
LVYQEKPLSDFVEEALKKANKCHDYWQPIYDKARDDLAFQSDDPYAQWHREDAEARRKSGRPVLTIDQLSQFVNQVSNDVRMNTPSIDIIPSDSAATLETAEILQGLIRDIEYKSNADDAYDNAVNFAIKCSIGYMRIDHDYSYPMSFDQHLYIDRIVNPFAVLFDCDSIEADGSDAKYCYILEKMDLEEYKKKYPDASEASFKVAEHYTCDNEKDEITLAEYFYIDEQEVTILQDGDTARILEDGEPLQEGAVTRKTQMRVVRRCKMNGEEKLEETTFPGDYIPIVPVYGEEAWEDGKRHLISLIRRSKDSQRMFNYWASLETELLMRSPKASIIAAEGTTEDYAEDYLNPDKAGVLRYKQRDSNNQPAPPPNFVPPPQIPAGVVNARQQTTQDIRATMGLYDAFLGQQDNAVSGVAIRNRQQEGNRAVFHYADNLVRSITHVGRILLSAIPEIYDTPRVVSVIGKEDTNDKVGINGMYVEGQEQNYSLAEGRYEAKVSTGASFSTMRQEASEAYQQMIAAQPQLISVMGDLLFKYMDFPGAQAISERFKRTMDPNLLDDEQDPQVAAMQMQNQELQQGIQMLQAQLGQLQQQLQDKQAEIQIKLQAEQADAVNDQRKFELELEKLRLQEQSKIAELELKRQELALKIAEAEQKQMNKEMDNLKEIILQVDEQGNFV